MRVMPVVALLLAGCATTPRPRTVSPAATVVFVCEHGNVKSVIAAALFNREATARGLALRAVARGLSPEPSVPTAIATALRAEGDDVSAFHPSALGAGDVQSTQRVVAIGVEPTAFAAAAPKLEAWSDVPPASVDYAASRDALRRHLDTLLSQLAP